MPQRPSAERLPKVDIRVVGHPAYLRTGAARPPTSPLASVARTSSIRRSETVASGCVREPYGMGVDHNGVMRWGRTMGRATDGHHFLSRQPGEVGTRPVGLDCRMETICETCADFDTGPEFVPVLVRQRDHARDHHQPDRAAVDDHLIERTRTAP